MIVLEGLKKRFRPRNGSPVAAVDDVSIEVKAGELVVLLGPSGSGKTTLLRCIAGLERPDEGEIRIGNRVVYSSQRRVWVPPERREVSMVFQSYALWPHMTVYQNVAYPLRIRRRGDPRVREALAMVGCAELEQRHPAQLSGGQQQRVAVARAIVAADTQIILFDEPLSSVDARVREELREELASLHHRLKFTAIYVTHDQAEASAIGDQVAILRNGKVIQLAPPRDLYRSPTSVYAARFTGAANELAGAVREKVDAGWAIDSAIGTLIAGPADAVRANGQQVTAVIRPEWWRVAPPDAHAVADNEFDATVERATFLGYCTEYRLLVGDTSLVARVTDREVYSPGDRLCITVASEDVHVLDESA